MTTFQFPLEKALGWRRTQLQLAEARVEQQVAALAAIDRAEADLRSTAHQAELEVRRLPEIVGNDLSALGSFRLSVHVRGRQFAAKRVECQKELSTRQTAVLEARRRCRLLERLKDRRWEEWHAASEKELDELAADSYLAQWARRHALSI